MNHAGKGIIEYKQNKTLQCLSDYSLSSIELDFYMVLTYNNRYCCYNW